MNSNDRDFIFNNIFIFHRVFQGIGVFPGLWSHAGLWPEVWSRPPAVHSPQSSRHARDEPKPHPELSHGVEVLLQRQLWLEGILWGEEHAHDLESRHINPTSINQLASSWGGINTGSSEDTTVTLNTCNTAVISHLHFFPTKSSTSYVPPSLYWL